MLRRRETGEMRLHRVVRDKKGGGSQEKKAEHRRLKYHPRPRSGAGKRGVDQRPTPSDVAVAWPMVEYQARGLKITVFSLSEAKDWASRHCRRPVAELDRTPLLGLVALQNGMS